MREQSSPIIGASPAGDPLGHGISSRPPLSASERPFKRRRIPLACTSCRKKKTRCDGQRPSCLSCQKLTLECLYEEPVYERASTRVQLMQRVRELENELGSTSGRGSAERRTGRLLSQEREGAASVETVPTQQNPLCSDDNPVSTLSPPEEEGMTVDELATEAFNDIPEVNIGYFGPSSNHALFRNLSGIFAHTAHVYIAIQSQPEERSRNFRVRAICPSSPSPPTTIEKEFGSHLHDLELYALPQEQELRFLINHFFSTVGAALPFVSKPAVLAEYSRVRREKFRHLSRTVRALLNIICAHASASLRGWDSEAFYQRSLTLLDDRVLRGANIELLQTLLLLSKFQQNNRRSIASWTLHGMAVKTAFQLGLHSPLSYKDHGIDESELRKRLWFGVVVQDRLLSASLGRPCLIPPQHVRVEIPLDPRGSSRSSATISPDLVGSLIYYNHVIALHFIVGSAIEKMYGYNIETHTEMPTSELLVGRLQLSWELEKWRENTSSFPGILSDAQLAQRSPTSYDSIRFQLSLSIFYYQTLLLVNAPLLIRVLNEALKDRHNDRDFMLLLESAIPAIKTDLLSAQQLQRIIEAIAMNSEQFVDRNALWYICNYTMFTTCLHLFGILLLCKDRRLMLSPIDFEISTVRANLDAALKTLKTVGRTSLMSRKARYCLLHFLEVFDSLDSDHGPPAVSGAHTDHPGLGVPLTPSLSTSVGYDMLPEDHLLQSIELSAQDFLTQYNATGFLDAEF